VLFSSLLSLRAGEGAILLQYGQDLLREQPHVAFAQFVSVSP